MFASLEPSPEESALLELNPDDMTPRQALNRLYELREQLEARLKPSS